MSLKSALSMMCSIDWLLQLMKLTSSAGIPQDLAKSKNCYITTDILLSHLSRGRLPASRAPNSCRAGISMGKLKGVMQHTLPQGHRYPLEVCPSWSPETLNDRNRKRGLSPVKFSKNLLVTTTSPTTCAVLLGMTLCSSFTKKPSISGLRISAAILKNTSPYMLYLPTLRMGLCSPYLGTLFCDSMNPSSSLPSGVLTLRNSSPLRGSGIAMVLLQVMTLPSRMLATVWGLEPDRVCGSTVAQLGMLPKRNKLRRVTCIWIYNRFVGARVKGRLAATYLIVSRVYFKQFANCMRSSGSGWGQKPTR